MVNDASEVSLAIGDYYVQARAIPTSNVCHLPPTCPTVETIDRATFNACVKDPIEDHLSDNDLQDSILYIVTTKGVPLRILEENAADDNYGVPSTIDRASVDSELCMLPTSHTMGGYVQNPYYAKSLAFADFVPRPWEPAIYLTCRLTGYEFDDDHDGIPDDVKRLIDRGLMPLGDGPILLDEDPTKVGDPAMANTWIQNTVAKLDALGRPYVHDATTTFVGGLTSLLGYCSWGSNDANSPPAPYYDLTTPGEFSFGALATTFVSANGRTFTWGESGPTYGQSLSADLVYFGVTGVQAHTWEPYLLAVARPDVLFDRYFRGYNLVDSFWMSSLYLGWQEVVVGDPLCQIGQTAPMPSADLPVGWNLISLPLEPDSCDPQEVLASIVAAGNSLENRLFRCPPDLPIYEIYPYDFQELTPGSGYWLQLDYEAPACTAGGVRTEDAVFPLRYGWTLVPYQFARPQAAARLMFTREGVELPLAEAVLAGWTCFELYYFTPSGYKAASPYQWGDDKMLRPWCAYWCVAYVPGVTLRIPACPSTVPPPRGDLVTWTPDD